jgi:hypothetical protein
MFGTSKRLSIDPNFVLEDKINNKVTLKYGLDQKVISKSGLG